MSSSCRRISESRKSSKGCYSVATLCLSPKNLNILAVLHISKHLRNKIASRRIVLVVTREKGRWIPKTLIVNGGLWSLRGGKAKMRVADGCERRETGLTVTAQCGDGDSTGTGRRSWEGRDTGLGWRQKKLGKGHANASRSKCAAAASQARARPGGPAFSRDKDQLERRDVS